MDSCSRRRASWGEENSALKEFSALRIGRLRGCAAYSEGPAPSTRAMRVLAALALSWVGRAARPVERLQAYAEDLAAQNAELAAPRPEVAAPSGGVGTRRRRHSRLRSWSRCAA